MPEPSHYMLPGPRWDNKTRCTCGQEFNTLREFVAHMRETLDDD